MIYNVCQRPLSFSSWEVFSLKLFTDICGNFKDYSSTVHAKTSYQLKVDASANWGSCCLLWASWWALICFGLSGSTVTSCSDQHCTLTWSDTWHVKKKHIFTGESLYSPEHPVIVTKDVMQLWWKCLPSFPLCKFGAVVTTSVWNSTFSLASLWTAAHYTAWEGFSCRPKEADTSNPCLKSMVLIIIFI